MRTPNVLRQSVRPTAKENRVVCVGGSLLGHRYVKCEGDVVQSEEPNEL